MLRIALLGIDLVPFLCVSLDRRALEKPSPLSQHTAERGPAGPLDHWSDFLRDLRNTQIDDLVLEVF